ncbi:polysaccharide deacetylase [Peribacillus acanthi]|uniref:polysaccharide deacetylase n=1 Tax=Peribacillus acanthi TaxID=2171554 RepID=UPI000D3EB98E|nr:polysaccharide deacetylase [Peribacillus acanthi]
MGKSIKHLLFFSVLLFLFFPKSTQASQLVQKLTFSVNDEVHLSKEHYPTMIGASAHMPLDDFSKSIGATLQRVEVPQTATLQRGTHTIHIDLLNNTFTIPNNNYTGSIVEIDGIQYIPIRAFAENLGFRVFYLSDKKTVRIVDGNHTLSNGAFIARNSTKLHTTLSPHLNKKKVYLTFDDGPNEYSKKILTLLNQKNVKGTFFVVEPNIRKYSNVIKQMVDSGHYIGLHSVSHNKNKLYTKPQNVVAEMEQTRKTLYSVSRLNSLLVRVPYGSKPYMTEPYRNGLVNKQYKMWDWHIDTLDWKFHDQDQIMESVKSGIHQNKNLDKIVILFHESKQTYHTLPAIIDYLLNQGYALEAYNPNEHFSVNFWRDARL